MGTSIPLNIFKIGTEIGGMVDFVFKELCERGSKQVSMVRQETSRITSHEAKKGKGSVNLQFQLLCYQ